MANPFHTSQFASYMMMHPPGRIKPHRTLHQCESPPPTFPCERNCDACIAVVDVDIKIAKAKQILTDLEEERLQLLSKVNNDHDTIIDRIPLELFTRILQLSLPHPESLPSFATDGLFDRLEVLGPLVFSAVSRRWREIVCSIPSLWAVVPIYVPQYFHRGQYDDHSGLLEQWIGRSGRTLLSVIVSVHGPCSDAQFYIPRIINNNSDRIGLLKFYGPERLAQQLDFSISGAGNLVDIHLQWQPTRQSHAAGNTKIIFGQFPPAPAILRLQSVAVTRLNICPTILTHFEAVEISAVDCLLILANSPSLVRCEIETVEGQPPQETASSIVLSSLAYLSIVHGKCMTLVGLADSLLCPSLRVLRYDVLSCNTGWENGIDPTILLLNALARCIQRSSASLESLALEGLHLHETVNDVYHHLSGLLQLAAPSLRYLSLDKVNCVTPLGAQHLMKCIFDQPISYPSLQTLTIDNVDKYWLCCIDAMLQTTLSTGPQTPPQLVLNVAAESKIWWKDMIRDRFSSTDIKRILAVKEQLGVSIKMTATANRLSDPEKSDIFPRVLDTLKNYDLDSL